MRVTAKGQVTIPKRIREKLNIIPGTEVDFIEEFRQVFLVKRDTDGAINHKYKKLRGVATVKMSTNEIMALTRTGEG